MTNALARQAPVARPAQAAAKLSPAGFTSDDARIVYVSARRYDLAKLAECFVDAPDEAEACGPVLQPIA